ncbi:MAG: YfhO family protein [Microgenomates group bacterium]|jgi:hypothetical protein
MRPKEVIIVLFFFIFITLAFFYQIFLGLIPLPTDLIVGVYHPWINYQWGYNTLVPIHNSLLSDAVSIIYPLKVAAVDMLKRGELPLWNPYMLGGYPLYASTILGLIFPTMIFYLFFSAPVAWTLQMMFQPLLASFFMYLLLRHLNLNKLASVFGGIAYGFGGFLTIWMQWNTQPSTALFLPILILLEDKYLISKQLKWGVLFSIFIALQITAGYLPIIQFTFIGLGIWFLFRSNSFISDLKISFFVILGILLSAIYLLPVLELLQLSQRKIETLGAFDSPFIYSENLIALIAPDFFGNTATRNFWGRGEYLDSTIYTGVVTLIFSIFGLKNFFNKSAVRFAACLFIVAIILAVPNPFSEFLYKLGIWGGSSLSLNRIIFLINFSLAILGAYGLSTFSISNFKLSIKPGVWVLSAIFGLVAGLFISRWLLINYFVTAETEKWLSYISISLRNLILPALIILVVIILILLIKKFVILKPYAEIGFILILIFELFRFGLKFNTFSKIDYLYPKTPVSNFLEKYPNDRILAEKDIFPANMWVPYKLSSISGYDGIYPLNIAQLIASANSDKVDVPPQTRWGLLTNFDSKIMDTTNTRFLVTVKRDKQVDSQFIKSKYKQVFSDKGIVVLENTQSLPRAYLTKHVVKSSDKDTLKLMLDKSFPTQDISLSDFEWNNLSEEVLDQKLTYKSITNSHVQIKSATNIDAYLVVLDSFYPGWKALIDGEETQIHRTNYNFRGILLPKGAHTVDFIYVPKSLEYGAIISGFSLLVITILLVVPKIKRN